MENRKNDKLMPNILFWEAIFSSFKKINELSNYFTELKEEPNNDNYPLLRLFYDLFNNLKLSIKNITILFKNIIVLKKRQDLLLNSRQLFNFLLEELHHELILFDNKIIKGENMNKISNELEQAEELFEEYEKNNKSFIQRLFFGTKQIKKICQKCKSITYKLDFLKFCPINIQNVKGFIEIEKLYDNIQREFEIINFCNNCNKKEKCIIKIDIVKEPKILILFIFNYIDKTKIDFSDTFNDNYELKSIVMGNENFLNNFFCCCNNKNFISYGKNKNKYFKIEKGDIKCISSKELDKGNPYIIFYKKKEEKEKNNIDKEINTNRDLGSKEILNKEKKNNNHNYLDKNKTERQKSIIKNKYLSSINSSNNNKNEKKKNKINGGDKLISRSTMNYSKINSIDKCDNNNKNENSLISLDDSKNITNIITNRKSNTNNNNNTNIDNLNNNANEEEEEEEENEVENRLIRIYFKFKDRNIIFIDVENYITFEKIINKLKEEYDWISIDINNIYFDEKKIDKNDISKKLGISHGDYIDINSNLIN